MGTNFYMITTNKKLVTQYFPNEYDLVDSPYFGYEIHIGKRSGGWKPIFQEHKKAYTSVNEMKQFIKSHLDDIRIFDEYNKELTLDELEDELITWEEKQKTRYMKYIPDGIPDEIFGGKKYLIESTKDDYDITIPYDHIEYENLDIYKENWRSYRKSYYSRDENGYNFMRGDFC